mmetsp:Transcript_68252/g.162828  ORF Transcript_68252/g.162828 Transcript_68252/m.162828 type:complete len:156 (-) Transcript_68252:150-617(-)|eukprot:CAMPEP_0181412080 /NCGR_PEP_ID=MMETSP1110-20121109/8233_1 /TAXON_ID=174948 /ORGANISM="Symbiodinium sp., Strain CCMP421" /LENGTH=155 /DNA_ID=CAMNT_0023534773 /DNA_START=59 /DNA_END=526 /DNA_ORIENTATION=+
MTGLAEIVQTSAMVTLLMYVKFFVSNMRWGVAKGKANLRAKEDLNNNPSATQDDVDRATHAGRIIQNDMENLPMGLVVIWAGVVTIFVTYSSLGDSSAYCTAHMVLTATWACLRVLHTVVYELHIGIARSVSFILSMLCLFGLMSLAVVAAFKMQ